MKKLLIRSMQILLILLVLLIVGGSLYLRHDRFGAKADGDRLKQMESKPNYRNGVFENIEPTPSVAEGTSSWDIFRNFFFTRKDRNKPSHLIPVIKTDLHHIPMNRDAYVWFGHSSYFIQLDGRRILVDPVFSQYATPVRISIRAFNTTYSYTVDDIPDIDILFITHDHWDHLDYNTFIKLKQRVKHIVTGLGVGAHLEKWGYPADCISELYWGDQVTLDDFRITATTARHFSGRTFKRNTTLWSSFVLEGSKKWFLGGDGGYGQHFKRIGHQHGPFDFAVLENGQYDRLWPYIHMLPEEVVQAAQDLQAVHTVPVHSAKFPLANHAWDEPLVRVSEAAQKKRVSVLTPQIGQLVFMDSVPANSAWWEDIK